MARCQSLDFAGLAASVVTLFYLAARFSKRFEMQSHRADLKKIGHDVSSRWIDTAPGKEDAACAVDDLDDIDIADGLIWFTEKPRTPTRGGRMFEAGYALASNKNVIICGPMENVFCHLENIPVCADWASVLDLVKPSLRNTWAP